MSEFLVYMEQKGELAHLVPRLGSGVHVPDSLRMHSTTIVGVRYAEGVVVCADTQATALPTLDVLGEPIGKLFRAGSHAVVGIAGAAGLAQRLARLYGATVSAERFLTNRPLRAYQCAEMLRQIAVQNFPLVLQTDGNLAVDFLLGVYDVHEGAGYLFEADPTGMLLEVKRGWRAMGSGSSSAYASLEHSDYEWKQGHEKDALRVALRSLVEASSRNAATGEPFIASVVDAQGARLVPDEAVKEIVSEPARLRRTKS